MERCVPKCFLLITSTLITYCQHRCDYLYSVYYVERESEFEEGRCGIITTNTRFCFEQAVEYMWTFKFFFGALTFFGSSSTAVGMSVMYRYQALLEGAGKINLDVTLDSQFVRNSILLC